MTYVQGFMNPVKRNLTQLESPSNFQRDAAVFIRWPALRENLYQNVQFCEGLTELKFEMFQDQIANPDNSLYKTLGGNQNVKIFGWAFFLQVLVQSMII